MNYLALIQSKNLLYIYIKVKNPLSALDKERQVITFNIYFIKKSYQFHSLFERTNVKKRRES